MKTFKDICKFPVDKQKSSCSETLRNSSDLFNQCCGKCDLGRIRFAVGLIPSNTLLSKTKMGGIDVELRNETNFQKKIHLIKNEKEILKLVCKEAIQQKNITALTKFLRKQEGFAHFGATELLDIINSSLMRLHLEAEECFGKAPKKESFSAETIAKIVCILSAMPKLDIDVIEIIRQVFNIDREQGRYLIATILLNTNTIVCVEDALTRNLYIYKEKEGIYAEEGIKLSEETTQKTLKDKTSTQTAIEVTGHLKRTNIIKRDEFVTPDEELICLENGILNTNTILVTPHTPEKRFISKIPHKFVKGADCPKFKKFLSDILPAKDVENIQEIFGYCLLRQNIFETAFLFVGKGSNGKSTLMGVLRTFLGNRNCRSISLQNFEERQYLVAPLYGKLANICADISAKTLTETATFRALTGRDTVTAERKYKDSIEFKNTAKLVFSANEVPRSYTDTCAFWRRWIITDFNVKFSKEERDENMADKLKTPEEMSGILNFAIEGLKRLLKNRNFTGVRSEEETRKKFIMKSDTVRSFFEAHINLEGDQYDYIAKSGLYDVYKDYCKKNELTLLASNVFHRILQKYYDLEPDRKAVSGHREGVYFGIDYK